MNNETSAALSAINKFRAMHESGCFVLPNPWDVGTAVYLQHLGFEALATTSAGFAFSQGLPDSVTAVSRDAMLAHIHEVVLATPLPVNADFQTGYADEPEGVAENVTLCIATGVAGLSIEDATGDRAAPLYEAGLAVERIRAARGAIDASGIPVVLTGRCEAWLVGTLIRFVSPSNDWSPMPKQAPIVFTLPAFLNPDEIAAIVKAVAPKPVNVLVGRPNPALSVSRLADLGVRRVSVGSALARVAWGAFIRAARSIKETGSFDAFADAAPFSEMDDVFRKRRS